ncbi:MAG: type II toxin-antitoxin system HicA family toxin [Candidatus Bipolaricaulia bacterium]
MSKVPSLPYTKIIRALQRDEWTVVRQRGSHIRLQKRIGDEVVNYSDQRSELATTQKCASLQGWLTTMLARHRIGHHPYHGPACRPCRRMSHGR